MIPTNGMNPSMSGNLYSQNNKTSKNIGTRGSMILDQNVAKDQKILTG